MPLNVDDIDWSDPIAANRLLRMKLAELEAAQGGNTGAGQDFAMEEYGDDELYEEHRYGPPPQPQQKSSRPRVKKSKNPQMMVIFRFGGCKFLMSHFSKVIFQINRLCLEY